VVSPLLISAFIYGFVILGVAFVVSYAGTMVLQVHILSTLVLPFLIPQQHITMNKQMIVLVKNRR